MGSGVYGRICQTILLIPDQSLFIYIINVRHWCISFVCTFSYFVFTAFSIYFPWVLKPQLLRAYLLTFCVYVQGCKKLTVHCISKIITAHQQTPLSRVCFFSFSDMFLASRVSSVRIYSKCIRAKMTNIMPVRTTHFGTRNFTIFRISLLPSDLEIVN